MKTSEYVDTVYKERGNFIVIGLTGRTGSGCTEAANILGKERFKDLNLKEPKNLDCPFKEKRKYAIVYNYAKENWERFEKISMSEVIFSFVAQKKIEEVKDIFKKIIPDWPIEIVDRLKSNNKFFNKYEAVRKLLTGDETSKGSLVNSENGLKRENNNQLENAYSIYQDIHELHEEFKKVAKGYSCKENGTDINAYAAMWQRIANIIRTNGELSLESAKMIKSGNMFNIARRANDFIKAIRKHNGKKNTLICIDAIRNPYEAFYFKDRYAAFYLLSINTDEAERRRRLSFMNKDQIDNLDKVEKPEKINGIDLFIKQNIATCIEISDIHINNPRETTVEKFELTKQLVKYITLIKHPGLITPTHIERCMQEAFNAKLNSGCLSRQVGAVITDENYSIKAVGWNEVPEGQVPCALRDIEDLKINKDRNAYSEYEVENKGFNSKINEFCEKELARNKCNLKGRCYQYCFKDIYREVTNEKNQVHTRALHAEENAFLQISKYGGQGIKGGNLFCTASPCELCSKKAYQLGIRHIYYIDPYPGISQKHILAFKNLNGDQIQMHLFDGAIGKAYTALYSQRISIKDELKLLVGEATEPMTMDEIKKQLKETDLKFIKDVNEKYISCAFKISTQDEEKKEISMYLFVNQADSKDEETDKDKKWISKFESYIDKLNKRGVIEIKKCSATEEDLSVVTTHPIYIQLSTAVDDINNISLQKFTLEVTEVGKEILDEVTKKENSETTSSENSDVKQ